MHMKTNNTSRKLQKSQFEAPIFNSGIKMQLFLTIHYPKKPEKFFQGYYIIIIIKIIPVWVKLGIFHPFKWVTFIGLHDILDFLYIHSITGKDLMQNLNQLIQGLWLQYLCVIHTTRAEETLPLRCPVAAAAPSHQQLCRAAAFLVYLCTPTCRGMYQVS